MENIRVLEAGTEYERYVDADVKKAIEAGTASDFYYFTEADDGKYKMNAKLPEVGCAGPGQPIFKIRENNNRLVKGFAKKFLDKDGNVDFKAGLLFIDEFQLRFGMGDTTPFSFENPHLQGEDALEDAIQWLSKEIDVPKEERRDFSNFCKAAFDSAKPAFSKLNFGNNWENWGTAGLMVENECKREVVLDESKHLVRQGIFYDFENASEEVQKAYGNYQMAVEEIQDLARINPVSQMKMIAVNECSGSADSNTRFAEMARQARREQGETVAEPPIKKFDVYIKAVDEKIHSDANSARRKLDKMIANAPTDEKEVPEYNRKLAELMEEIRPAIEQEDELKKKGPLKWDEHVAPVLGTFEYENQTYYLTTEAFASETDQFMEHPGMTDSLVLGIFRSEEEFQAFYSKDDPHVLSNENVKMITEAKEFQSRQIGEQVENLFEPMRDKKYNAPNLEPEKKREVHESIFEAMKIYRNFGESMSPDDKLKQGASIILAATNKNILDQDGQIDDVVLDSVLSRVCVNGVPMKNLIKGNINEKNVNQAVDMVAGYIAKQMDEKNISAETVSVISNGKHIPLTYTPPKAPQVTTKTNLFSSRETKAAHEREVLAREAGLKREEIWETKNKQAELACQSYNAPKQQRPKERVSLEELGEFKKQAANVKSRTSNNVLEYANKEKKEREMR